jgi:hypothetical protein
MQTSKLDERLRDVTARSAERLVHYKPVLAEAAAIKGLVMGLVTTLMQPLEEALEAVQRERREAWGASQGLRAAEEEAEAAFEALYHGLLSAVYARRAREGAAGEALVEEQRRTLGGLTPARFRSLGLDRTISALGGTLGFAGRVMGVDDPLVQRAQTAHTGLVAARREVDQQSGEGIEAFKALEAARDEARRRYSAARQLLEAAFSLEGRDDLRRFMPALHIAPRSGGAPEEDEPTTPPPGEA